MTHRYLRAKPPDSMPLTSKGRTDINMGGKAVALGRAIVTVMQSAQAIMDKHVPRGYAASSAPRRSLS
jgi:hypothetical protein